MEGVSVTGSREAAASLIRWWRDAGVDTLVEDAPRNWLARPAPSAAPAPAPAAKSQPPRASAPASLPGTLDALLAWMRESAEVPEARWGRTRVLPAGDPQSGLMILTDMPEPGDAEAGILMAGELGALFDRMLAAIGRDRASIWLAPFATIRSPGGRVAPDAAKRLAEIALHHIALIAPKRLLIMGDLPNRALIGPDWQTGRGSLQTINLGEGKVEVVATFHPRLLLQRPAYKAQAWKDLQLLMKGL